MPPGDQEATTGKENLEGEENGEENDILPTRTCHYIIILLYNKIMICQVTAKESVEKQIPN